MKELTLVVVHTIRKKKKKKKRKKERKKENLVLCLTALFWIA